MRREETGLPTENAPARTTEDDEELAALDEAVEVAENLDLAHVLLEAKPLLEVGERSEGNVDHVLIACR